MAEPSFQFDLDEALDQQPKVMLRNPFASGPAPYFATEERNQQLALLEHLSRYSAMLLVVEGQQGSGKTAFMEEFARHQVDNTSVVRVQGSMLMTAGQLLEAMYSGLQAELGQNRPDSTFGPLLKLAVEKEQEGRPLLILIDNAHELNTDAVIMLLDMMSLANENQPVPHVVLFSEHALHRNLDAFQKSRYEQLVHTQALQPYSLAQTKAYLLHRVRAVGGGIELPFSERQIKRLHEEAGGRPGTVNELAQKLMGMGVSEERSAKKGFSLALGFPMVHMALLSIVMLGIIVAVVFYDPDENVSQGAVIPLGQNRQPVAQSATIARIEEMQKRLAQDSQLALPPIPTGARQPQPQVSNTPVASTKVPVAAAPQRNTPTLESIVTVKGDSPPSVAAPVKETPVAPAPAPADRFDKTEWWLTQNPSRYTLQLLGTYSLDTVKEFIRDQGSLDNFSYFQSVHNDKNWFVVVYGTYRNRSEAIAAVEQLPKDLRSLNPWARSIRGIQQDIRKAL